MFKRMICLVVFVSTALFQSAPGADIPDLAAWWALDDGAGTTVVDSSGNGHDGQTFGDPAWVAGVHGGALEFDGVDDRVEMPTTSLAQGFPSFEGEVTWTVWFKAPVGVRSTLIAQDPPGGAHVSGNRQLNVESTGFLRIRANSVGALNSYNSSMAVNDDEWHHAAVTIAFEPIGTNDAMKVYIDGDLNSGYELDTVDINSRMAASTDFIFMLGYNAGAPFLGTIDDVAVFGRVLSADEVMAVMAGRSNELASRANPGNGAIDVLRDTALTWNAGEFAATHDVYFGTSFEDVDAATVPTAAGLDVNSFDPGRLEFGQTYYWRVDEVNGTPDKTVFKGDVWSFTAEPYSIDIPGSAIGVTASSFSNEFSTPEKTLDGSGLDPNTGAHGIRPETMWFTAQVDLDPWIQYEFDDIKKLDVMKVWNSNGSAESAIGWGVKDVEIAYSVDGDNWDVLAGASQFSRAPGLPTYDQPDEIAFSGAVARYVRLNIQSNWGGILMSYGLSEVQFSMIPVQARTPEPASGTADILPDSVLTWRAGREAVSHTVNLGTDPNELTLSESSMTNSLDLATLDLQLGQTYYWQVDEVNDTEVPSVWQGLVWSFSTVPYVTVEDFDRYGNVSPDRPFQTWLDGFGYSADEFFPVAYAGNGTGSGVGHDIWSLSSPHYDGDIMEGTIVKSGKSMPLYFDNSNGLTVSETEITFDSAQDWTANGIKSLSLNIYGAPDNTGQLYLKINGTKISYDGLSDALQRPSWIPWNIDLAGVSASLQAVTSLAIGVEGAGATGLIYIDEIRLYPLVPQTITPTIPGDDDPNLVTYYAFEGNANDSKGNYPGTAVGDPGYTAGVVGQALVLDNVDDHIVNTFDAEVTWPAYTVSLWVKTDLFNQDIHSGLFNNNSAGADFQIAVNGNDGYEYRGANATQIGPASSDWVHLAVTCDGTQTQVFYNGLFVSMTNEVRTQFGQIAIGVNRGMTNMFGGTIDEVRVYNRALSDAEAAGLAGITDEIPVSF